MNEVADKQTCPKQNLATEMEVSSLSLTESFINSILAVSKHVSQLHVSQVVKSQCVGLKFIWSSQFGVLEAFQFLVVTAPDFICFLIILTCFLPLSIGFRVDSNNR